jgi:hypothetical protein
MKSESPAHETNNIQKSSFLPKTMKQIRIVFLVCLFAFPAIPSLGQLNEDVAVIHFRLTGKYADTDSVQLKVMQDKEVLFFGWVQLHGSKKISIRRLPGIKTDRPIQVKATRRDKGNYPDWLEGEEKFNNWAGKTNRIKINQRIHNYIRDI